MSWIHGTVARIKLLLAPRKADARIASEMQFHVDMETDRLVQELGLHRDEARRRAFVAFGGVEKHREELRDGRGAAWLGGLSVDFKLGIRMLLKYPGLTLVGVLGMSVAVAIGALGFSAVAAVTSTSLPFEDGDRVVSILNVNTRTKDGGPRTRLEDLPVWRDAMRTVSEISAHRSHDQNLVIANAAPVGVRSAEISVSGLHLTRARPVLGRTLTAEDERSGEPVMIIGHDLWQQRFGGRADVIGTSVQLGSTRRVIVGVMPEDFAFPVNNEVWVPLRTNPSAYQRGEPQSIQLFGRLASGASVEDADREAAVVGQRFAAADPRRYEDVRARVMPYTRAFLGGDGIEWLLRLGTMVLSLLLVVIGTNVAVLVYARTASRAGEIAVRTALGASRRRIVMQLFAEALVLSSVASVVGLLAAQAVFERIEFMVRQSAEDQMPFWVRLDLTPGVVLYVAGLAVLAAVIIGVIPGLKATRHRVSENLKLNSGASLRLGRSWTFLLVAQVAVSVAALPFALIGGERWFRLAVLDRATPATEASVIATPMLDATAASDDEDRVERLARYTARVTDLAHRLETDPNGIDVVMMSAPPGAESYFRFELDRANGAFADTVVALSNPAAVVAQVDQEFFSAFDVGVLRGREFGAADYSSTAVPAIVNRSFVTHFLKNGNALGRRIRRAPEPGRAVAAAATSPEPWWEIVGVVEDFPALIEPDDLRPKVYLPLRVGNVQPLALAVRSRTLTPAATADRVREIGMAVDPAMRFLPMRTVDDLVSDAVKMERLTLLGLVALTLSVVLLSGAGIYALMSFTVARRQREIGIRSALGAGKGRVLAEILSRAVRQIAIGIAVGVVGLGAVASLAGDSDSLGELFLLLLQVTALMLIVGVAATIGPARRALRVEPTEALRGE